LWRPEPFNPTRQVGTPYERVTAFALCDILTLNPMVESLDAMNCTSEIVSIPGGTGSVSTDTVVRLRD
jgi:hypothetical protein